jgi:hypothetical protein
LVISIHTFCTKVCIYSRFPRNKEVHKSSFMLYRFDRPLRMEVIYITHGVLCTINIVALDGCLRELTADMHMLIQRGQILAICRRRQHPKHSESILVVTWFLPICMELFMARTQFPLILIHTMYHGHLAPCVGSFSYKNLLVASAIRFWEQMNRH